jgi:hypothetical protein
MSAAISPVRYRILASVSDGEEQEIATIQADIKATIHTDTHGHLHVDVSTPVDRAKQACQAFADTL